ncbi:MFS family permease [Bradyrhizobium sp. USDA 4524]|uniref:MFS transporter n=1 Tax=unclassified Bradyrhizobium TaxID=2631580 RepID=UPI00209D84DB|nr:MULTISPECIES: MFS transporter [unclassified Bradyrhizobium]MCP1845862.1 MFS family permease [Bradyrhizobium sp. USDA 4538]MCP1907504.1 MFS family permease [Bradyrhizobium sp. USDA 4537]MCP1985290.1 MFS family permease [Bradyrhizobium sp. USDA 4539]
MQIFDRLRILSQREFALFFVANAMSVFGTTMVPISLSFALIAAGGSATEIGGVLASETAPMVLLVAIAGVVGDRWRRDKVIILADLLRFSAQLALFALLFSGHVYLPIILLLSALIGVGNAFYGPAAGGILPQLVAPNQLREANGLLGMANSSAFVMGPALAGIIIGLWGAEWAIAVDAATYAISAICIALIRPKARAGSQPVATSVASEFGAGLREVLQRRWLTIVIGQFALLNLIATPSFLVLGPIIYATTTNGAASWGFIASSSGVGGVLGGLAVLYWRASNPLLAIELAILVFVIPLSLLALNVPATTMLIGGGVLGAAGVIVNALLGTMIQREVPQGSLSRVYSIMGAISAGVAPLGYALVGPLSEHFGSANVLWFAAVAVGVIVLAVIVAGDVRKFQESQ